MFVHVIEGESPIIITVQHDGWIHYRDLSEREQIRRWRAQGGPDARDDRTLPIALRCRTRFPGEAMPSALYVSAHRAHVDTNRGPSGEPYVNGFRDTYLEFHSALDWLIGRVLSRFGRAIVVDLHGFLNSPGPGQYDVVLGTRLGTTSPDGTDQLFAAELAALGYRTVFSPDRSIGVTGRFRGGWTVARVADEWQNRPVDAVQVELHAPLRAPGRMLATGDDLALMLQRTLTA